MQKIGAVILAAGESSRFGRPKQLVQFRGKSLVRRVVDTAKDANCSAIVVVLGSKRKQIERELKETEAIVASSYSETLGVPALFDRSCFQELLALDDETGAKAIILSNRERVAEVLFPEGKIDIDTAADYEKLTAQS